MQLSYLKDVRYFSVFIRYPYLSFVCLKQISNASIKLLSGECLMPCNLPPYHSVRSENIRNIQYYCNTAWIPILQIFLLWGRSNVYAILQTAFHTHFPVWKLLYFNSNFIAIDNYYWFTSIVAVNGLAPNRRQGIICINDGIIYLRIYASPVLGRLSTSSYAI